MRWIRTASQSSQPSFAPPDRAGTSHGRSSRVSPKRRDRGHSSFRFRCWGAVRVMALILFSAFLLSGASGDKHLSVYSVAANYSLPVVQRDGHDYVGLLELLEPLGKVSAKVDGSRWRLRYNNAQAEFQANKTRARVQDREADLGGKFLIENNRGLVPLGSLSSLLPRILGGPVSLHEVSDRLFIGSIGTHFTASLAGEETP